jgi:hypothetical protein
VSIDFGLADEDLLIELSDLDADEVAERLVDYQRPSDNPEWWNAPYAWIAWEEAVGEPAQVEGLGHVEVIDPACDGESGPHMVFRISNEAGDIVRHFRVDGAYISSDDLLWDDELYEVVPAEKVITVYTRV